MFLNFSSIVHMSEINGTFQSTGRFVLDFKIHNVFSNFVFKNCKNNCCL